MLQTAWKSCFHNCAGFSESRMVDMEQIYICAVEKGYHYNFKCMNCGSEYELVTGPGRYGNLGPFECPKCGEKYYATIDDHQNPSLYVAKYGEHPSSMFDVEGRKRSLEIKYNGY